MGELTEDEFGILKTMCDNMVYVACIPDVLDTDPEQVHLNHANHMRVFNNLAALGFAENVTGKFDAAIREVQADQQALIDAGMQVNPLLRKFQAFAVTKQAIDMFSAPEGLVN